MFIKSNMVIVAGDSWLLWFLVVMSREINMEMAADRANSEVNVYGAVGAVFLFLMVALILGLSFNSPCKSNEKYLATSDREQVT